MDLQIQHAIVCGRAGERMCGAARVEIAILHEIDFLHSERSAAMLVDFRETEESFMSLLDE
jgi:hypothetical protein